MSQITPSSGNVTVVAETTQVETFSAISRRRREGTLDATTALGLQKTFLFHSEHEYLTIPIDNKILVSARVLVDKYPLRALDAIQLACALEAMAQFNEAMTFLSADRNLLAVAALDGLGTDDPNLHP